MKKASSIILVLVMLFMLVACSAPAPSTGVPGVTSEAAAETAAPAPAQAQESSEYSYVVGHFGGVTGNTATVGQAGVNGALLAIKQWNDNGGVLGGKVGWVFYDDGGTSEGAVKAVTRLIDEDKVDGILTSQLSGNIQACGAVIEASKVPAVGTGMSPVWLQQGWSYLFRALANSQGGVVPMADTMERLGCTKLGTLVYQDEGNISAYTMLLDELKARGVIEITTEEMAQIGDTDWTGQLSKIISTKPNGILIYAQGEQASLMIKQLRSLGYGGYIYGAETMSLPDIRKVAGDGANGIVFFAPHCIPDSPGEANSDLERAFLEAYIQEFGEMPASDVAYRAYDGMTVLLTGVKNANSKDGTAVRNAIQNIKDFQLLAGKADFTAFINGECLTGQQIYITHDGKNIYISNFLAENPADTYKP